MTTGILHDQNLEKQIEKQMGCMTGFLHLFDRNQIINGKRIYTTKRLSSYQMDYSSQSESSVGSPAYSGELRPYQNHKKEQQKQSQSHARSSLDNMRDSRSPVPEFAASPARMSQPLPVFEFKEGLRSSWKFKETPRLSLDSRATVDGKGSLYPKEIRTNVPIKEDDNDKQRRSPSVIARLMGLDALPEFSGREPMKKVELRRSASESRVSKDLKFVDGNNFQLKNPPRDINAVVPDQRMKARTPDYMNQFVRTSNFEANNVAAQNKGYLAHSPWKSQQQQRKSYFDSQDFFPEPKQSGYLGEIEKRLKLRGIDEPAKDLETLKQILEALQLKGLLHSKRSEEESIRSPNYVFDRRFPDDESPIVIIKPSKQQVSINRIGRTTGFESASNFRSKHRNNNLSGEITPPVRRDRPTVDRNAGNGKFSKQNQSPDKSPSSVARRRVANGDFQRKGNDLVEQRRNSPTHSPKLQNSRKTGLDQNTSRSPRNKRSTSEISSKERTDDTISESSRSSSSQMDLERSKMEDYKEGRSLLERCDKLLNSIAEITAATELQPSPVSVLDSSFYKDESSPSPVMKRCIDFKDQPVELEDENWSPVISPIRLKSNDSDFLYVSEILRASNCLSEDTDVFWLLEKHQYRTNSSDSSRLHRKLVFDIITEILDRKTQLPPWKTFPGTKCITGASHLEHIWSEFRRIREKDPAEDLFEIICGVLKKDMAGDAITGWGDTPIETSETVLDIERLIFKDLVVETIHDLVTFTGRNRAPLLRRKLVF
ncbi:zinc finger CCCH domain protein [Thalictrum thalictroides]|uniref:Zinc finger CCCH domain protein n=1 Tax=Thalictrum thalictroides TaxID=46969 RepID=A0A7J6X271_THATH|nr:zinc finger CCCH domain protein [Thalictrum thalictroides]